jgi:hypothetical protein
MMKVFTPMNVLSPLKSSGFEGDKLNTMNRQELAGIA